jgi:hypothetical protein
MTLAAKLRRAPTRLATGAFILNSGLKKLQADEQTAANVHGMAVGTYPMFEKVPPATFVKALGIGETSLGAALLLPIVPTRLAGLALTAFSGGLLGMYWRTPGMHENGRPTAQGTPLAKDAWLFGIGTSLVIDSVLGDAGESRAVRRANREAARAERDAARIEQKITRREHRRQLKAEARAHAKAQAKAARMAAKQQARTGRSAVLEPVAGSLAHGAGSLAHGAGSLAHNAGSLAHNAAGAARGAAGSTRDAASTAAEAVSGPLTTLRERVGV